MHVAGIYEVILTAMELVADQLSDAVFPCRHFSSSFLM
jgi:hypothetical protein